MNIEFLCFAGICALSTARIILLPSRLFHFPYFMALTFSVWILPQLYAILLHGQYPDAMTEDLSLMCLLCICACFAGYWLPTRAAQIGWLERRRIKPKHLSVAALVFATIGITANILLLQIPIEQRLGIWTGTLTKYAFLAKLSPTSYTIGLFCYLKWKNKLGLMAALLGIGFPLHSIIFGGRREPVAHIVFATLILLYITKKFTPPRLVIVAGLLFGLILIPNIGDYRKLVLIDKLRPTEALQQLNLAELYNTQLEGKVGPEIKNALHIIAATKETNDYQWGAGYWNQLVFGWVPKQFVGEHLKYAMMFNERDAYQDYDQLVWNTKGFSRIQGSTVTGVGDTFRQFGFAGFIVFFLLSWLFRSLSKSAIIQTRPVPVIFYTLLAISAMKAVTHQTLIFPEEALYYLVFVGTAIVVGGRQLLLR